MEQNSESVDGTNEDLNQLSEPNSQGASSINIEYNVPQQIEPDPFEANEDGQVPIMVQAGYNYSGAVTRDGIVYTWGGGEFGRLGDTN